MNSRDNGSENTVARKLGGFWRDYQWWVIGLAALTAFVLGFVEFFEPEHSVSDAIYNSLKLFIFHLSKANQHVGPGLNIARFLAPGLRALSTTRSSAASPSRSPAVTFAYAAGNLVKRSVR